MSWGNKEMKTERLVTMSMVRSAIKNVSEERGKGFSRRALPPFFAGGLAIGIIVAAGMNAANVPIHDDQKTVAGMDNQNQETIKKNSSATKGRLLTDDFLTVTASCHA